MHKGRSRPLELLVGVEREQGHLREQVPVYSYSKLCAYRAGPGNLLGPHPRFHNM